MAQRKFTKLERDKLRLFKKLRNLDRKIGELDIALKFRLYLWPNDKITKAIKLKREKLDLRRAKARIERKKYGIKPKQP